MKRNKVKGKTLDLIDRKAPDGLATLKIYIGGKEEDVKGYLKKRKHNPKEIMLPLNEKTQNGV